MEQEYKNAANSSEFFLSEDTDAQGLIAIVRRLTVARSVEEIHTVVTRAARELIAADGVTFVLRDGDLCHYVDEDAIAPLWKGRWFPIEACISGWCMMHERAVAVPDIYADDRIPHDAYRPTFVRSLAMVPVGRDDPMAAMGAYWAEPRTPTHNEVEILQAIANAAALATANVRLKEEKDRIRLREEQKQLISSELGHRFKNHIAIIEALLWQTLKATSSLEEFAEAFSGRLRALGQSQVDLTASPADGLDLGTLVRNQLSLTGADHRIDASGPDVPLPHDAALDLGLALYELGSNAVKHGALSDGDGRVTVDWAVVEHEGGRTELRISWREEGGPPVAEPQRTGFGTTLLDQVLARKGGGTEIRYEPTGLVATLRLPLGP